MMASLRGWSTLTEPDLAPRRVRPVSRRSALAAGILGGITAAGLPGCSALPKIPGLGGAGAPAVLGRVDPAAAGSLPLLPFTMTRPTAIAEVLELTPESEFWKEEFGARELLRISDPSERRAKPTEDTAPLAQPDHLLVPSAAISVHGTVGHGVALWEGGAQVLDQLEDLFADAFIREGDELRIDPSHPTAEFAAVRTVTMLDDDLVFTGGDDPSGFVDTGTGLADGFVDLDGLFSATGIDEPHLAAGSRTQEDFMFGTENSKISEWLYTTELTSRTEQTTRGAIRAEGDLEELRDALQKGAQQFEGSSLRLSETEIDGDLVLLTLTYDENAELPDLATLASFYNRMPEVGGPGISIEAG